jgi:hypothetical protein
MATGGCIAQFIKNAPRLVRCRSFRVTGVRCGELSVQPGQLGIAVHVVIGCEREQNGNDEKPRQCDNEIEPFKASPNVRRGPRCEMRMQCTKPCVPRPRYPRPVRGFASWFVTGFAIALVSWVVLAMSLSERYGPAARLQEVQEQVLLLRANDRSTICCGRPDADVKQFTLLALR